MIDPNKSEHRSHHNRYEFLWPLASFFVTLAFVAGVWYIDAVVKRQGDKTTFMLPPFESLDALCTSLFRAHYKPPTPVPACGQRPSPPGLTYDVIQEVEAAVTAAAAAQYSGFNASVIISSLFVSLIVVTACVAAGLILMIRRRSPACAPGLPTIGWLGVLWTAGVAFVVFFYKDYGGAVIRPLTEPTFKAGAVPLPWMVTTIAHDNLGLSAALFLAATTATLWPLGRCLDEGALRDRRFGLRWIMYLATALLVLDVIQYNTFLRWAMTFVPDTRAQKAIEPFVATFVSLRGLVDTALLAGIYLPTRIALEFRVQQIHPPAGATTADRQKYLKEQGLLPDSFVAEIRPIVAILLPLFTGLVSGPVGGVLQKLSP
jgi:hypothetical protein